jgi:hypothetical protein
MPATPASFPFQTTLLHLHSHPSALANGGCLQGQAQFSEYHPSDLLTALEENPIADSQGESRGTWDMSHGT